MHSIITVGQRAVSFVKGCMQVQPLPLVEFQKSLSLSLQSKTDINIVLIITYINYYINGQNRQ